VVSPGSLFDGVGALVSPLGNCSGTLLSSGIHVLTAAHCVTASLTTDPFAANSITIRFDLPGGSQVYSGSSVYINPSYSPVGLAGYTGDLAILILNQAVDPAAQRYGLHTGSPVDTAYLVGYGRLGQGATGSVAGTSGITKRVGLNEIEAFDSFANLLLFDFDNGLPANNVFGTLGLGLNEATTAPGDSGGPAFIESGGVYRIVGVNVVGGCPIPASIDFDSSCAVNTVNSSFGEFAGATSVAAYQDWIQSIVDAPEPSTLALFGLGLLLTVLLRAKHGFFMPRSVAGLLKCTFRQNGTGKPHPRETPVKTSRGCWR
jgi:hypothetical protein